MNCYRIRTAFIALSFAVSTFTCLGDAQEVLNNAAQFSDNGDFKQAANVLLVALQSTDGSTPPAGAVLYYVVRAVNAAADGTIGSRSDGAPRVGRTCP